MADDITAEAALAKVQKLLAMTASPHIEEARTSAYMACRLIREHGLEVCDSRIQPLPRSARPQRQATAQGSEIREIRVRHAGRCRCCRGPIKVGEVALWATGRGLLHLHCTS
jgi:hypothetical protein